MDQYVILHEDDDILVANKLAPLPVQKDKSGDMSLQEILGATHTNRGDKNSVFEAAHRVDRRTSGVVVFAKTRHALVALEAAFREREIRKTYIACVEREPQPASGTLEHVIRFDRRSNLSKALPKGSPTGPDSVDAKLDYTLVCRSERYFFLEIAPETGRHHQIRAQLAAAGWPIRGDLKYGARRSCKSGRIMLHAVSLEFTHPRTGERVVFHAPFPTDEPLWTVFEASENPSPGSESSS
ncbi:MAG: RluA family pseudouridine synthase [Rectinema sp.]